MSSLGALGITTPSIFEYFKAPYNRLFGNNEKALKSYLKQSNDYNNTDNIEIDDGLPSDFDWRNQTLKCVHDVRDQQMCGSCYSFASTGFLSDRFCIHSEGNVNVTLAPQDMVTCDFENFGCSGGYLVNTIDFLQTEGIVSEECMPYQGKVKYCTFRCTDPEMPYQKYYCKKGSLIIATTHEQIKTDLMTNGPMMVGLTIYEDFYNYKSGIYHYTSGVELGGHAIKLIGWGSDQEHGGALYWICQNQWSSSWGENGFIKIYAGEVGLDSMAMACMPDLI